MIGFRSDFVMLYLNMYVLAMASTAMAVFLGCLVEDPKVGQEMLPLLTPRPETGPGSLLPVVKSKRLSSVISQS